VKAREFRREDESVDEDFYATSRLVTHIDAGAIDAVTHLYREYLPSTGAILDLMSSWVSHLPADAGYTRVCGLGMNEEELAANPRLTDYLVHNLNSVPQLPFADGEFEAATICVSIQYLIQPPTVLRELARALQPASPLVVTFSNRCFPTKAVAGWLTRDARGHMELIGDYLEAAGNWQQIEQLDRSPAAGDPLYAVVARTTGA
jgi:SAM-dependent methyltransferase